MELTARRGPGRRARVARCDLGEAVQSVITASEHNCAPYAALETQQVPMMVLDHARRVLGGNAPARLLLLLGADELRLRRLTDLMPAGTEAHIDRVWNDLLAQGHSSGHLHFATFPRGVITVRFSARLRRDPNSAVVALSPAHWPEDELAESCHADVAAPRRLISARECDVLELVAHGQSIREIGEALTITEATVRSHISNINAKLRTRNRAHAVAVAMRTGLIFTSASRLTLNDRGVHTNV